MKLKIFPTAEAVARAAAAHVAQAARDAVRLRGVFTLAVSGGQTPWQMLRSLASEDLPWESVHLFQVDERVAPDGHGDRNLTHLTQSLAEAPLPARNIHPMPVNDDDLETAALRYAEQINAIAGEQPMLDLVHLGLGADGHTASLVPSDPALDVADRDVAICGVYQGRRRMTLTFPILNRARGILWLATGAAKQPMLERLQAGDASIPAGRVNPARATILADSAAAGRSA